MTYIKLKKHVRECGRNQSGSTDASPVGAEILKGIANASTADGKRVLQSNTTNTRVVSSDSVDSDRKKCETFFFVWDNSVSTQRYRMLATHHLASPQGFNDDDAQSRN